LTDTVFRKSLAKKFFAGSMAQFWKIDGPQSRGLKLASLAIADMVGEYICKYAGDTAGRHGGTAALEELRGHLQKESLPKWVGRLPRLKSLTLWKGFILNETVAEVIKTHCLDFDALTIYECRGDDVDIDAQLASFFAQLRSNTLRYLQVISRNDIGVQTFISLNNHYRSLKYVSLRSLPAPTIKSLPFLKGCTAIQRLDLEDADGRTDLEATDGDVLLEIISWLTSCKQLKSIKMERFVNGPRIMTSVCLEDAIHLESLQLETYPLPGNQDFHRALAQQTSLESVHLRADAEDSYRDIDALVQSLSRLKKLKYLNILDISDYFRTSDIQLLAMHLSKVSMVLIAGSMCLNTSSLFGRICIAYIIFILVKEEATS
jgi:hypothetical protein